jgi:eukaryotic-like serine/threonine-protein kinase
MALASGAHLGPYEIVALIGAGGMGEVYRAKDERLGREVAIKVLPAAFSADANRLSRFQHEARAASALNHPNILAIYDVGTQDGSPYLVSELLEGDTLRHKLGGGGISSRKAVEYASQIARGLGAAHEKGIVHRDLKPENLFVTKDAHVKILDFGLAKLIQPEVSASKLSVAPTASRQTEPGVVMGTAMYMSPEQVRGESVDHRSDVFALGAILYEMLSGKRPFAGNSSVEIMNAILKDEPADLSESNSNVSPGLARVVQRCMDKDPAQRFQSARDLSFALEAVSGTSESRAASFAAARKPRTTRELATLAAAIAATALAVIFAIGYFHRTPQTQPLIRASILLPSGYTVDALSLSPDGRQIAFVAENDRGMDLFVQSLDSLSARQLAPVVSAVPTIFWSPDSRFIAFSTNGKLKKIAASGGSAQTICDAPDARGGSWSPNGIILISPRQQDGLYSVSSEGGTPTPVTHLDPLHHFITHRFPYFLPDGRHFLSYEGGEEKEQGIFVGSLDNSETKLVLKNDTRGMLAQNQLLFVREETLMAQHFNLKTLTLEGEARTIADHVFSNIVGHVSFFAASENGMLVYVNPPPLRTHLIWLDRQGKQIGEIPGLDNVDTVRLSHDGRKILMNRYEVQSQKSDVWIYDMERANGTRFTFNPGFISTFVWSWDDKWVFYGALRGGGSEIVQKLSNGAGEEKVLIQSRYDLQPRDVSPDGRFLIYSERNPGTSFDLMVLPLSSGQKPYPFVQTAFLEDFGRFSPDGKWVAFASEKSGRLEVYVRPFDHPEQSEWQVSTSGGNAPNWRNDGKELYFGSQGKLTAVEVKPGPTFQAGIPQTLYAMSPKRVSRDVSPDGQRSLFVDAVDDQQAVSPIRLVTNWTAALKQ